jgi:hypothetical protein
LVNRNHPVPHCCLAAALTVLGSPDEARAAAQAGLVLNPAFTLRRCRPRVASNYAAYLTRRERVYEGMCIRLQPIDVASRLGVLDEARAVAKAGLALNPDFTIRRLRAVKSSDHPTVLAGFQRLLKGLGQSILSAIERQQ